MSIRKTPLSDGEYYHIYNRGNNKRKIFHNSQDYDRFLRLLYLANSDKSFRLERIRDVYLEERGVKLVAIGAYCIMPNHFHILVKQTASEGISKFMHKLLTAYSMYYNTRYERGGGIFEGKFKSQHIGTDNYLKYIFSYIHLNPVKLIEPKWKELGIRDKSKSFTFLDSFHYSSYLDFMKIDRKEKAILDLDEFPDYFPSQKTFKTETLEWLNFNTPDE